MIKIIQSFDQCQDFVSEFWNAVTTDEKYLRESLKKAIENPEKNTVWAVFRENGIIGLFSFLILPEERYMEMLTGLSHEQAAYREMLDYLQEKFSGYEAGFVFSSENTMLREQLETRKAQFEPEQQKMVLGIPHLPDDMEGVELYTPQYEQQYCAIHNQDVYWTGEKIVTAPDRFRTVLAIQDGKVAGYLDVTIGYEENEVFDVLVLEKYRRMGYGRKLLAMAIQRNAPSGMMLTVNVDNFPAIRLYESLGFSKVENENSLTVCWKI